MTIAVGADLGIASRLVVAAIFGALIGLEVRLHDIGAGVRMTATMADLDGVELLESRALGA